MVKMRRISANYIYTVNTLPLKNCIVELDDTGKVLNIIDTQGDLKESRNLEFYNGIITPGFINTHCHLELSELKGLLKQNSGLPGFLAKIIKYKQETHDQNSLKAIEGYDRFMRQKGIVAVGDIANTNRTIHTKKKSKIYYHTFVEAIGLASNSEEIFQRNKSLFEEFLTNNLSASIVPHATYSVSKDLFLKLKKFSESQNSILSIHNQETESENQMFKNKSGDLANTLQKIGIDLKQWKSKGKNSIQSVSEYLPANNNVLFVHNTFSTIDDILWVNRNFPHAYWCLCPNSNLYIENKLPDIKLFYPYSDQITIGTDSLASNTTLSVLDEMKTITNAFKNIEFIKLIQWATLNGAKALKIDDKFGSIEIGKSPGLNLITNFNFEKKQLTQNSEIKVLV
ncbi:MAG TPA: amidohydrolase [Bacteroidales bacterium]|nr:amidohydrolase [Bacteroidales bacterium]